MRVLQVTPIFETSEGGMPRFVAGIVSALVREVTVAATVPTDTTDLKLVQMDPRVDLRTFPRGNLSRLWNGYSRDFARFAASEIGSYDLIHAHGLWHYSEYVAFRQARRSGTPFVVSPQGSLAPLALANDRLLKIVYTRALQRRILKKSSLLHALTGQEADEARRYGISTETVVIPLGIELETDLTSTPAEGRSNGRRNDPFRILLLGRVVPNKGLEPLIEALAELRRRRYHVHLEVAGPYEKDYYDVLFGLASKYEVTDSIEFTGLVTGARKSEAFSAADVFVLPSYTEGFSIAVLEAMACRLPVILTPQCNFSEAAESGAGFEVEPEPGQLATAIEHLVKEPSEAARMGRQARALVEREYTWDTIAPRMITAYSLLRLAQRGHRQAAGPPDPGQDPPDRQPHPRRHRQPLLAAANPFTGTLSYSLTVNFCSNLIILQI